MVILSLSPLKARKSDNYRYSDSWKSDNFWKEAIKKEAKNWYQKGYEKGLRVIPLQGEIEKSPILLAQYWKNEWLDGTTIILYFGDSNNIFADWISVTVKLPKYIPNYNIHKCLKIKTSPICYLKIYYRVSMLYDLIH